MSFLPRTPWNHFAYPKRYVYHTLGNEVGNKFKKLNLQGTSEDEDSMFLTNFDFYKSTQYY
jgi:hypothetical protein